MAFTVKYLQRLNPDELNELLSDSEAELTDAEKERIGTVIAEKEKPDDPPPPDDKPPPPADDDPPWLGKVIDGVSEKVIGSLTAAEEIVNKVTGTEGNSPPPDDKPPPPDDKLPPPDDKPPPPDDKPPPPDDKPPGKRSLAARFNRNG